MLPRLRKGRSSGLSGPKLASHPCVQRVGGWCVHYLRSIRLRSLLRVSLRAIGRSLGGSEGTVRRMFSVLTFPDISGRDKPLFVCRASTKFRVLRVWPAYCQRELRESGPKRNTGASHAKEKRGQHTENHEEGQRIAAPTSEAVEVKRSTKVS